MQYAGTISKAVGQHYEGKAGRAAAEFNARVNDRNARATAANTREQVERERRMARRRLGNMRAAVGASGITLSGSALEAIGDNAAEMELDALTIQHEGKLKELGYRSDAESDRMRGRYLNRQGQLNAASTLLGGMGSMGGAGK